MECQEYAGGREIINHLTRNREDVGLFCEESWKDSGDKAESDGLWLQINDYRLVTLNRILFHAHVYYKSHLPLNFIFTAI
jgi:hypothetical protein